MPWKKPSYSLSARGEPSNDLVSITKLMSFQRRFPFRSCPGVTTLSVVFGFHDIREEEILVLLHYAGEQGFTSHRSREIRNGETSSRDYSTPEADKP